MSDPQMPILWMPLSSFLDASAFSSVLLAYAGRTTQLMHQWIEVCLNPIMYTAIVK
jgi:hypothetical protein